MRLNDILRNRFHCHVIATGDKDQVLLILLWSLPISTMKKNAAIELEISENKHLIFFSSSLWMTRGLWVLGLCWQLLTFFIFLLGTSVFLNSLKTYAAKKNLCCRAPIWAWVDRQIREAAKHFWRSTVNKSVSKIIMVLRLLREPVTPMLTPLEELTPVNRCC